MSLTPTQLAELQSIVLTLSEEFPHNQDGLWDAAIRMQLADLGPTSGSGGQPAFDAAVADIKACQDDVQDRQGREGSPSSGFDVAVLQVVPPTSTFPPGNVGEIIFLDVAPNTYIATDQIVITPAGPNSVQMDEVGTTVARTLPAASGGFEVNNLSTGAGFERVLTVSDSQAHNAEFVTMSLSANIPNERVLVGGAGITLTDGGAGGNATLDVDVPIPASTAGDRTLRADGSGGWVESPHVRITFSGIVQIHGSGFVNTFLLSNDNTDANINTVGLTDLNILGFTNFRASMPFNCNTPLVVRSLGNTDNEDRLVQWEHQDGTLRADIGFTIAPDQMRWRNLVPEGLVQISALDTGSGNRIAFQHDPDGSLILRGNTDVRVQTGAGASSIQCDDASNTGIFFNGIRKFESDTGGMNIRADINTATPPTTEIPVCRVELRDLDGSDLLGTLGFIGGNDLIISNAMHGGEMFFRREDAGGDSPVDRP